MNWPMVTNFLIALLTLLGSHKIRDLIGSMAMQLITRLFGLILAAIAAQLIVEGLAEAFPAWVTPASPVSGVGPSGGDQ